MLNQIRKSTFSHFFLSLLFVCLFLLAKTKTTPVERLAPQGVPTSIPPISQALPIPAIATEVSPSQEIQKTARVFSRQLNRHRKVVLVAKRKKTKTIHVAKLNKMAEEGLLESPQGAVFNVDPYESETSLDPQFALSALYPRELPLTIHEGVVVARDTTALWDTLETFPTLTLAKAIKSPTEAEPVEEPQVASTLSAPADSQELADLEETKPSQPERVVEKAPVSSQNLQPMLAVPTEIQAAVDQGRNILQNIRKNLTPTPTLLPSPKAQTVTTQSKKNSNHSVIPGVESPNLRSSQPVGQVYGKLTFDGQVQEWLDRVHGHVELRLQRGSSRDPQEMFFVDYQYPETEFSWDGREVTGGYHLVANFFSPNQPVAVAQVVHPIPLTADTAKRRVIFHVRKSELDEAIHSTVSQQQTGVVLSGTVFEANPADHRAEKTVPSAEVEVLGYPQWGVFYTDSDGTFRIPQVKANSEFKIQVKANGYYPTQVVVPVFQTTGYVSVHLVAKNMVNTITGFFTKKSQADRKALILGRVFDPQTRAPQADQEISLAGRSAAPIYFNILPELGLRRTTSMGSFAYFNVEPAFRSVGKAGSTASHLIQAAPGSAYYVESGRGGSHVFRGKLLDPYRQQAIPGLVKVVGATTQVATDENGQFEITHIDLSPGIITFEVEAEGYPKSWHTVPWSTRDVRRTHTFYLPEADLVEEARASVARVTEIPHRGMILGGAESRFFGKDRSCVYVELTKSDGHSVSFEQGPYPLHPRKIMDNTKPLCLSKARPGFSFYNIEPGEYLLKWKTNRGELLRSRVVRVGSDRVSVLIN